MPQYEYWHRWYLKWCLSRNHPRWAHVQRLSVKRRSCQIRVQRLRSLHRWYSRRLKHRSLVGVRRLVPIHYAWLLEYILRVICWVERRLRSLNPYSVHQRSRAAQLRPRSDRGRRAAQISGSANGVYTKILQLRVDIVKLALLIIHRSEIKQTGR